MASETPDEGEPGAGGWVPKRWTPIIAAAGAGMISAIGAVLTGGATLTIQVILGAAFVGAGGGIATFLGIRSAGPRKLPEDSTAPVVVTKPPGQGLR